MDSFFITFEGIEGSGKSTQISLLEERLKEKGHTVVVTREPGGTDVGVKIRKILLDSSTGDLDPVTELLLFSAARSEIVSKVIAPALADGKVVLCDRFTDSTIAYQGLGRAMDRRIIQNIIEITCAKVSPDLTIILDLPVAEGLRRSKTRLAKEKINEERFEQEEQKFHERVRYGFLEIAKAFPERVKVIEANGSIDDISAKVWEIVSAVIKKR